MDTRILIVDDDPSVRKSLRMSFEGAQYAVCEASTIAEARAELERIRFHLATVDVKFLGPDGLHRDEGKSLAREIRSKYDCGIIMISVIDDQHQHYNWLEDYADDTITKPVHVQELLARTSAVLRRYRPGVVKEAAKPELPGNFARFAGWTLDLKRVELLSAQGKRITLAMGEFKLLKYFLMHPQEVLSRQQIGSIDPSIRSWNTSEGAVRALDMRVSRLRCKLSLDGEENKRLICTMRKLGYMLAAEVEWSDEARPTT